MPVNEQLASSLDLSLHDRDENSNGLLDALVIAVAVDEQPHCQQIGLFRVDPFQLALNVAPNQHGPQ